MENVLVRSDGHIAITDFGLSKLFDTPYTTVTASPRIRRKGAKKVRRNPTTKGVVGTWCYMAPEVWLSEKYSYPVDWFAYGIILYSLHFGSVSLDVVLNILRQLIVTPQLPWDGSDMEDVAYRIVSSAFPFETSWDFDRDLLSVIKLVCISIKIQI